MQAKGSRVSCDCMKTLSIFLRFCSFLLNGWPNHKIEKREHYDTYLSYKTIKT